uniref:C2H2-type domain-containing protein n=1 Tax=Bracon brevicornis TaxID=1563983 RepID=A0A6V7J8L3_9HYME
MDAKQSPLAMLAKTCSQIGADPPTSKSLLAPLDKSSKTSVSKASVESREKSSPVAPAESAPKSSFKPYESCLGREKAPSPEEQQRAASSHSASGRSRTPGSGKRCSSNQSASSRAMTPQGRKTATPNNDQPTRDSPASRTSTSTTATDVTVTQVSSNSTQQSKYSPSTLAGEMKDMASLGTYKPPTSIPSTSYLGYPPMDAITSSLVSQHHAALKNGLAGNPYLNYARMKSASGADSLVPACRDPYCTGCQLNSHLLGSSAAAAAANSSKIPISSASTPTSSCPAGCAQCDHKTSIAPNAFGPMSVHNSVAAAYAHAQFAALAASHMPYVCNWIASDTYCGKRFGTSDELLQHLRSHTSASASDPAAAATALSLLTQPTLPSTHPLFSRTYPTPPISPLATARYHPYGKPGPLLPPALSGLGLSLPHPHSAAAAAAAVGLSPYFSPYPFYGGPRLGAASGMHP